MHPWMLEQMASEHRRDLLARAEKTRLIRPSAPHRWRAWARARARQPEPAPTTAGPIVATPSVPVAPSGRPHLRLVR